MSEQEVGVVTHYFGHLQVAAINLTGGGLAVGDRVHIVGHTTDVSMIVETLQIEHSTVREAKKGESVGTKVPGHVREHDKVFKVTP